MNKIKKKKEYRILNRNGDEYKVQCKDYNHACITWGDVFHPIMLSQNGTLKPTLHTCKKLIKECKEKDELDKVIWEVVEDEKKQNNQIDWMDMYGARKVAKKLEELIPEGVKVFDELRRTKSKKKKI